MGDSEDPTAHSSGDRIIAKANGGVVEGDWQQMQRLAQEILSEADNHKTDLQKIKEINGAHVRMKCENCGYSYEEEYVRDFKDRGPTPQKHADYPDDDCTLEDVSLEPFCPRHGTIPMAYDECDRCASTRNMMNR